MKTTFARWVSIVAHPFVTGFILVIASAFRLEPPREAFKTAAAFIVLAILPVAFLTYRQVRRGKWEHVDASNRRERPLLYAMGIGAALLLFAYVVLVHPQSFLVRTIPITVAMFVVAAIATRWVKLSIHLMFAAVTATALLLMRSPIGWVMLATLPLLAWSRLILARHTWLEVLLGAALGAVTGYALTL